MSRFLYRLGRAAALRPWRVVVAWVLFVGAAAGVSVVAGGALQDDYTLAGTGSQQATDLLKERFPALSGADARVVVRARSGKVDAAAVEAARGRLQRSPHVSGVTPAVPSGDGATALITVRYDVPVTGLSTKETLDRLRDATAPLKAGHAVEFGGQVPENVTAPGGVAEAVGVVAALVILLLAFGSVVAAGLPLVVALAGLGAGVSGITVLAAVTNVATTAPTLAIMVGLGVGIDYALFILTRHREGLAAGLAVPEAAGRAVATAGQSVIFAGATVLLALSGLVVSRMPAFMAMGFATGIVVAMTVAAAVTLLPAVLGLAGRRVLRRRDRRADAVVVVDSPRVRRWADLVARRPWAWLLAALLLMLTLAAPALGMRTWPSDASSEPTSNTARRAYDLVAEAYGPGANGPLLVAVDLRRVPADALPGLGSGLAKAPGVVAVAPPQVSPGRDAAVIVVTPAYGPQDERVTGLVEGIRERVLPDGAEITGFTAAYVDLTRRLEDRLWPVIGVVVATSFLMLMVVFRSLLAPLKAAAMNLLSIGAAYGVLTAVFQWGWGAELLGLPHSVPVSSFILLLLFAVLFGISMDYEVFLLSRVREEWLRTGDARGSVATGLAATGRLITSAALIMVAVFLGFALDPGLVIKQMGVGLAVAVALDATVVRMVLVPATMALLGRANWWLPRPLARILPDVDVHGVEPEPGRTEPVPV
ncbi:MMPL family transporter [Actinomadura kijaniata]|uniref:RND superfamily putative drug exporter n=1 Tax=Actinomadura namibiensis TaxID=182080 RepID=A0A7W3LKA2_ACTNM|nr:MMPL family transporter [Actinomadura namibiensis]MBA8949715.1 RND superfamily putative drug exporter [Actinomadura namibiensis]